MGLNLGLLLGQASAIYSAVLGTVAKAVSTNWIVSQDNVGQGQVTYTYQSANVNQPVNLSFNYNDNSSQTHSLSASFNASAGLKGGHIPLTALTVDGKDATQSKVKPYVVFGSRFTLKGFVVVIQFYYVDPTDPTAKVHCTRFDCAVI